MNVDEELAPVAKKRLSRMPRLLALCARVVWAAAPREFATVAALQLVAGLGVGGQLLLGKRLLDHVVKGSRGTRLDLPLLIAFGVVTALVAFAGFARLELQRLLNEQVARYTVRQVVDAASWADLVQFDDPKFHDRLQRAHLNAVTRPLQMVNGLLGLASSTIALAGISVALFLLAPLLIVVLLVGAVPAALVARRASSLLYRLVVDQTGLERQRNYLILTLAGKDAAKEIRAFVLAAPLTRKLDDVYDLLLAQLRSNVRARAALGLLEALLAAIAIVATLGVLIALINTGRLPLSSAGVAVAGVLLLGQRLRGLSGSAGSLYEGSLFLEDFTRFIAEAESARPERDPRPAPAAPFKRLRAEGVGFTYPSQSRPALNHVDVEVRAGEVVALVGENGSGKTTLAKVLAGLYQPQQGRLLWDDADTRAFSPGGVRDYTAVIFQDFVRYYLSASENIALGRAERLDQRDQVVRAAQDAGAHEAIARLPNGYDTLLGPEFAGGSDLSGGQWQRIALARAFFRDAPFLILDEPTAALDPRAEYELFERVRALANGRAVLLISHRFSSVRSADRIYVLQEGAVVEHGSHEQLMLQDGLYRELFDLQASAYREAGEGKVLGGDQSDGRH